MTDIENIVREQKFPLEISTIMKQIDIFKQSGLTSDTFNKFNGVLRGKGVGAALKKTDYIKAYRYYCSSNNLPVDNSILSLFTKTPTRHFSGVSVVAVVLSDKPNGVAFTCAWNCKYCPQQEGQPRSYLKEEPAVARANMCDFDAVKQMLNRIETYKDLNGTPDKLEVIVLGGTWASYPVDYQYRFITELYYAANIYDDKKQYFEFSHNSEKVVLLHDLNNERKMLSLAEEIEMNETSKCHIIGLTLETRPDCINLTEIQKFREMGVTRIQMGVQHINDRVLERVNRGCKTFKVYEAIKMLKDNCFKVDIHIMPDLPKPLLPGVDPNIELTIEDIDVDYDMFAEDQKMMGVLITDEKLQADQWKIYAYQVVPYSEGEKESKRGLHKSYSMEKAASSEFINLMCKYDSKFKRLIVGKDEEGIIDIICSEYGETVSHKMFQLLVVLFNKIPEHIRVNRTIRDIPTQYVSDGIDKSNYGEMVYKFIDKHKIPCTEMRNNMVRNNDYDKLETKITVSKYDSSEGTEYYISVRDDINNYLLGFLRLRLTEHAGVAGNEIAFESLRGCALIRELHVYGDVVKVSAQSNEKTQHKGYGKMLMSKAEEIAIANGYKSIAVIAGVGVRNYYKKLGYVYNETYLIKNLDIPRHNFLKNYVYKIAFMFFIISFLLF